MSKQYPPTGEAYLAGGRMSGKTIASLILEVDALVKRVNALEKRLEPATTTPKTYYPNNDPYRKDQAAICTRLSGHPKLDPQELFDVVEAVMQELYSMDRLGGPK